MVSSLEPSWFVAAWMPDHPRWRTPLHSIRDAIRFSSDATRVRGPAFAALDAIQHSPPETQLDALFALATAMSEAIGMDPHEMVARARNILPAAEGPFTEQLQTARDYARGELM